MSDNNKIVVLGVSSLIAVNMFLSGFSGQMVKANEVENYKLVNPMELVATPSKYINSKVKINAKFDKFSTLGLDYKPAFRDSKDYISFLIRRNDLKDNHVIPLSELKLIIKREKAEELIDLESGDQIEFTGEVFSSALNDPWIEVQNVKVLSSKTKTVADKKVSTSDKK